MQEVVNKQGLWAANTEPQGNSFVPDDPTPEVVGGCPPIPTQFPRGQQKTGPAGRLRDVSDRREGDNPVGGVRVARGLGSRGDTRER